MDDAQQRGAIGSNGVKKYFVLEEATEELACKVYGRRREIALPLGVVGQEDQLVEALRWWLIVSCLFVTAQPGRGPEDDDYDPQRENEVRAATAVLERLLGAWEYETDHVQTARAVSSYTPHPSTRYQEPWE
ncbi:hypothetical protein EDB83DRAFT_2520339 [Lactarius deliciosus]|nr:hypothetical protein EDB83DRAFT_2520339 [Lactarius deliciosus]